MTHIAEHKEAELIRRGYDAFASGDIPTVLRISLAGHHVARPRPQPAVR